MGTGELLIASGKRLGGRYRLERPLGRGGMAAVWLATDERLDRPVAVKVLSDTLADDESYLTRFRREAHTAASLQHPNLVTVYDYDAGERPYLVMEYVEGGDLAERIAAGDVPDPHRLAHELLAALQHIHAAGVLHRDIKPQNVLIDASESARLTDFGIAQPANATSLTRTGHLIGTESYIAPEVKSGQPASERADLYALGVVLADVAREGAGASLWELVDRLRDPDPAQRPRSASAALAAFERGARRPLPGTATQTYELEDEPVAPPPADLPPASRSFEPTPPPRRHRGALAGWLALGAVAFAALAGLLLFGGGDDDGGTSATRASSGGDKDQSEPKDKPAGDKPTGDRKAVATDPAAEQEAVDGAALNEEGYALWQSGDPAAAIPVLERAVEALRDSGDELTYNYALFNLGAALVDAGRPEEAIPYLEERMQYDDGQLAEVEAKLDEARALASGEDSSGGQPVPKEKKEKPPKGEKPGHDPQSGGVPPPFEEDEAHD